MIRTLLCCLLLGLLTSACKPKVESPGAAFALQKSDLKIAGHALSVEIADTQQTMAIGLMYRQSMPADHGMLFVFPEPRRASFWMHNTPLPLDIAYLDGQGKILEIHAGKPLDESPISSNGADIAYALETNIGWFARHNIPTGTVIQNLPRPSNR